MGWLKRNWVWDLGGAAVLVGIDLVAKGAMAASPPSVAPGGVPTTGVQTPIVLVPNQPQGSLGMHVGDTLVLSLPPGGSWMAPPAGVQPANPPSGNAAITYVYQGPGLLTYYWVDSTGAAQTFVLTLYTLAPGL